MKWIIIKSSYPGTSKSYNFVWNVSIFKSSTLNVITKSFMIYLRSFFMKSRLCFFKFAQNMFWNSHYKWLETISDIVIVLKIMIFPYSVSFLIFHIFNIWWISVTLCYSLFPFSIFCCKRTEYLIFVTYCYLDLNNAYHRLPL